MAYTRAWTNTTPADTDQASTLGAVTRNLRLDIDERMNTLLGSAQWEADPVGGYPITKVLYIPAIVGYPTPTDALPDVQHSWFPNWSGVGDSFSMAPSDQTSDFPWNVPIVLPVGATLTKVQAMLACSGISVSIEVTGIYYAPLATSAALVSIGSVAAITSSSARAWHDCAITPRTVIAGDVFLAIINGHGTGPAYYGLEVSYTVPTLLVGY